MSYSCSTNSKAILVSPQVQVYFESYSVKDESVEGFCHDGAKANTSVVSSLA